MELIISDLMKTLKLLRKVQETCRIKKESPDSLEDRAFYAGRVVSYNDSILLIEKIINTYHQ